MHSVVIVLNIVLSSILLLIVSDYYKLFFGEDKICNKRTWQISLFVYFIIIVCMNFFEFQVETRVVISCILIFALSLNFSTYFSNKVFCALSISSIIMCVELAILYCASLLLDETVSVVIENKVLSLYIFCTARLVPFAFIKWIKYKAYINKWKAYRENRLQFVECLVIMALPVCSLFLMYFIYDISNGLPNTYYTYISFSIIGVVAFNVIFYLAYFNSLEVAEIRSKSKLQKHQIYYYTNYYNELKTNLREVQKFKHDMKYILLNAISELANEQEIEIKQNLYNKLDGVIENFYLETHKNYTGNSALDLILNYGVSKAQRSNIKVLIHAEPCLEVNIDCKVLSVILGNAIDNAIEACEYHNQNIIKIYLVSTNNNIYIEIGNKYSSKLTFEDDLPITNKADSINHGVGLKSIKKLVEENKGIMFINTNNNNFILQIHLTNR